MNNIDTGFNIVYRTNFPDRTLWYQYCGICEKYTYFTTGGCTDQKHNERLDGLRISDTSQPTKGAGI